MATIATHISPADHGRAMTLEEFLEAEEEPGYLYELARGVLEVTEVPNDPHAEVICNLYRYLCAYEKDHPRLIRHFGGGAEFRLWLPGMISGRNPNVAVVLLGTPADHRGRRPPALVMEVVSEGSETRDYETKREEYLAYGIREYWIIDPLAHKVTVLVRFGDVWREQVFTAGQSAAGVLLPGFAIAVETLWSEPGEPEDTAPPAET